MAYGSLSVSVVEARNLKSADTFSKNDPYVKVELPNSNQKFQTKHKSSAGQAARWDETFTFNILAEHTNLHLHVYDKDSYSADDLLGTCVVGLDTAFKHQGPLDTWLLLNDQNSRSAGELRVILTFQSIALDQVEMEPAVQASDDFARLPTDPGQPDAVRKTPGADARADAWQNQNRADVYQPTQASPKFEGGFEARTPAYSYVGVPGSQPRSPVMYIPQNARTGAIVPLSSVYSLAPPGPPRPSSTASSAVQVPDLFR